MGEACRNSVSTDTGDDAVLRVVDDLSREYPISQAELDAVEAFLMPLIAELLIDGGQSLSKLREAGPAGCADAQMPRKAVAIRS